MFFVCPTLGKAENDRLTNIVVLLDKLGSSCLFVFCVFFSSPWDDRLCGLVLRVLGYRSGGPGSIPGNTRKKNSGSGTGSTQPREYNRGAT
jgi:hypothetical protein